MKRIIDYYLNNWKNDRYRKSLLLRGARQVGKTHAARTLGASFPDFFEINLENQQVAQTIFEKDLQPDRIIRELSALMLKPKSGEGRTLKSIQMFLESHQKSPYGVRFSTQNYSEYNKILSYPLYAVFQLGMCNNTLRKAIEGLV